MFPVLATSCVVVSDFDNAPGATAKTFEQGFIVTVTAAEAEVE